MEQNSQPPLSSSSVFLIDVLRYFRIYRYEIKLREQQEKIRDQRKSQVGTGARSEKIRTYNYKVIHGFDYSKLNFEKKGWFV